MRHGTCPKSTCVTVRSVILAYGQRNLGSILNDLKLLLHFTSKLIAAFAKVSTLIAAFDALPQD